MLLRKLGYFLIEIIQTIVFAISIFLFLYLLILQPHKIKGQSMEPNFHDAEYLLTDKLSYRFNDPQRGDVIVFKAPPDFNEEFIKRIIGLPGEQIEIKEGHVYINGRLLSETYLPDDTTTQAGKILEESSVIKIPPNSYAVLGDNREHSYDSRNFGFITRDKIIGKAWFVYWPPKNIGKLKYPSY